MQTPDFARLGPPVLEDRDLLFLFEHFPVPGVDAIAAVQLVHERPSTLESLLESDYVFESVMDRQTLWLSVSPRLVFNVLLRHALRGRRETVERQTLHYLANVLALFVSASRVHRVEPGDERTYEYLFDLVEESAHADGDRAFMVQSHIGNYALFLSGVFARAVEHRHRFRRRPVSLEYYCRMGRSYYHAASRHPRASEFGLKPVFGQLAGRFDYYRGGLERMAAEHLGR